MKKIIIILILIISSSTVFSQRIISGRAEKVGGGILTAVKVYGKEAPAIFTFTDDKGKYKIELPSEVKNLVFTYSGMEDKTIKIKEFDIINAILTPSNFKKFRYGLGFAYGTSNFTVERNDPGYENIEIPMTQISIHADFFYRFRKRLDIQLVIEEGLNIAQIETDSTYINNSGLTDTVHYTETIYLNRISTPLMVNYYFPFTKSRNHSAFIGLGPQFQHFSFLKLNTLGARFQAGVNINEHGFTTKLYLALDISSGTFNEDNEYVQDLPYRYSGSRIGIVFIF